MQRPVAFGEELRWTSQRGSAEPTRKRASLGFEHNKERRLADEDAAEGIEAALSWFQKRAESCEPRKATERRSPSCSA